MFGKRLREIRNDVLSFEPFSEEEQLKLLREYREGNINSRNILINSLMRFAAKHVFRFIPESDREDVLQDCVLGLITGLDKFDFNNGARITSYLIHWIKKYIFEYIERKTRERSRKIHFTDMQWENIIPDEQESIGYQIETEQEIQKLKNNILLLNEKEQNIILKRYGFIDNKYYTLQEIATENCVTREAIRQVEIRSLKKIELMMIDNKEKNEKDFLLDNKLYGLKIRKYREHFKLSKVFFSKLIGIKKETLTKWEKGKSCPIKNGNKRSKKDLYNKILILSDQLNNNSNWQKDWSNNTALEIILKGGILKEKLRKIS